MRLEAIIWDVDGTLVDSEELHRYAFNRAFEEFGLDWQWSWQVYCKLLSVTGGKERIRHYAEVAGISESCFPVSVEKLHSRKTQIFHDSIQNGDLTLRAGVQKIINEARDNGIRLAIATTTTTSNVETLFDSEVLNPDQWEVVVAGDQVEKKKPAPDVYLEALRRLGLKAEVCLAVEDSVNGMKAALAAGIPVVITTNAYTQHQDFKGAIVVLEILEMLRLRIEYFEAWHAESVWK
ncbi:HAD-IA family hydrolase [Maridesulfovibrio hydrothermalis]|uniref:Protein CbbY n=1 Tax=Maridesulfovibrio hydrothermalis AM13 = DSM 14728 TaxID=1121451 RepID=L0RG75_9BACT|nr:HAD-IA family hydrolase [Maridesulfovibrio hydrothermalis]CCO25215.1 Protein CbbY [Maridesulfovibrio hydrothermalis AM13 = DSM 14728]